MHVLASQNYQHLLENMHLIVNCPRNSKIALDFKYAKRVLDYNNILTVLIYNFKKKPLGLLKF